MDAVGDTRRYVIVGNGFAGTTAAEQLRKHDPSCSITLFTDEPYTLYNRIALPPLLRKQVTEQKVIMRDVAWHEKQNIALHLETRVDSVVPEERYVTANGTSYPYDALLVATGGRPNPHPAPGADGRNVYNFQYMSDTLAISRELETAKAAVAVGGSFIAYELAEAYTSRKVETHWIMRGPRVLHRMLDEIAGELIDDAAKTDGVHMHYGDEVDEFVRSNGVATKVRLKSGTEIEAQCFGIGLGLTMNTELLAGTGVEVSKNGILCDARLETNVKGIFAAGDIADFYDPILEMRYRMGTWNNAGAHGKVVAQNMMGGEQLYDDVPEYSSLLFKGQTITQFGLSPEYRSDIETVFTVDREKKWYRALYFWEDRLVGGCFMGKGNRSGKRKYVETIKSKRRFPKPEWKTMLEWTHD
ncbi:MAG TPA: NAD(P)/FAD-dependent oxidoreductase [Candidatus Baltobacteraceae bacterium]|nr:NAD(P)/FAD-dependent oxidoreductase [Candidatus Baltobacteraceae bacterium]